MGSGMVMWWVVGALVVGGAWGLPAGEGLPLGLVSELTSRLSPGVRSASRLQESRLVLPSPPDLEAIRKVAQILIMLGQQVIPAIIGEPQAAQALGAVSAAPAEEAIAEGAHLDQQPPVTSK